VEKTQVLVEVAVMVQAVVASLVSAMMGMVLMLRKTRISAMAESAK
jgi:hypothetical protein